MPAPGLGPLQWAGSPGAALDGEGGVLLAYRLRYTEGATTVFALSDDGGRTWDTERELVLWDEASRRVSGEVVPDRDRAADDPSLWGTMWGWTFGSPTAVQAPDGSVLVTFFAQAFDGVMDVRCVRLEV